MGLCSIVHVWNFKVTLLLPVLLSLYFFQDQSIFNEIPFPSIQFILTAYTKASGLWRPRLDPPTTKHTIFEKQTQLHDLGNLQLKEFNGNPMQWHWNQLWYSGHDLFGIRLTAKDRLSGLCFTDSTHARDWFASGNWKGFQQRRSAFGCKLPRSTAPEANILWSTWAQHMWGKPESWRGPASTGIGNFDTLNFVLVSLWRLWTPIPTGKLSLSQEIQVTLQDSSIQWLRQHLLSPLGQSNRHDTQRLPKVPMRQRSCWDHVGFTLET